MTAAEPTASASRCRGRVRHVPGIRAELRAVQRASRRLAESVDVLLRESRSRRGHAANGAGVHASRRLQTGPRLQEFVDHFHLRVKDRMRIGGFDAPLQDLMAMKTIGLDVIGLTISTPTASRPTTMGRSAPPLEGLRRGVTQPVGQGFFSRHKPWEDRRRVQGHPDVI